MQQKQNWQAYSNGDRNKVIEEVKKIIASNYGSIINFNMFSDLAMSLIIEIEESRIQALHDALMPVLKLSGFGAEGIKIGSKREWLIFMNISFVSGRGDLKREVPAVPG